MLELSLEMICGISILLTLTAAGYLPDSYWT